jgi:hypothetical protein
MTTTRFWRQIHLVRRIMCNPESVSTVPLISPTLRANAASVTRKKKYNMICSHWKNQYNLPSNGFCIWFLPKSPKSPPRLALEQSENCSASSASVASPESIRSRYESRICCACSFVLVTFSSRQLLGRRDFSCFTNKWLH